MITELVRPGAVWPVDKEYAELYEAKVSDGRAVAKHLSAAIVAIARNAMPFLPNTLGLVEELQAGFQSARMYVYENDSTDDTAAVLDEFAGTHDWFTVEHDTLGGIDSRGFEPDRTIRLAKCRNKCLDWVRANAASTAWTIVLDMDPHAGFCPDGVFNSIAWLSEYQASASTLRPGGMASYSLYRLRHKAGNVKVAQYDSWAARPNWWRDRREEIGFGWFSMFLPPVGSPPLAMNSAFGGLGVYDTKAILSSEYVGGDCEHVALHRGMRQSGYQMYLNPGCRYVAFWMDEPDE